MQVTTLAMNDMNNETQALAVAKVLDAIAGVQAVKISTATGQVRVSFDETLTQPAQLHAAAARAGLAVTPVVGAASCCGGCCG